ncbi:MAG: M1 family metallopeptidase [Gemmatimonadota bacterium]
MRILVAVGVALVVSAGAVPEDGNVDDYPRRIGIDVEHYRFELTLTDDTDRIRGRATVRVRYTSAGVTSLPLDLINERSDGGGMTVTGVEMDGQPLRFAHQEDILGITLPEVGRAGGTDSFVIEYEGTPAGGLRAGPNKYGDRTFFSDNWPNRARHWLPTVDHPYDKATSEMIVTAPAHYQVVSNGVRIEESDRLDGTRTTHWQQDAPIATWLYVLGVARFAVQHVDDALGVPIETWVYPQDREAGFYDFAVPTRRAMEFYADNVGPYAYDRLANITSPVTGGGMEAATSVMYNERSVTGTRDVGWRNVIIHEVAHQWFGNAVTESDWDDIWLSEGFATYFTLLFIEHAYGRDEFVDGLRSSADRVFQQYEDDPGYRIVHDDLSDMRRVTSGATYQKGSWVLHMLRNKVGDETFWAGIRAYYARYINGNATTADFRAEMEAVSGEDLSVFFDQWLYQGGNPRLEGWWDYDPSARAIRIELNQTHEVGPTYQLELQVGLHDGTLERPTVLEELSLDARFHRFVIPVDFEPTEVTLDPDVRLLFQSDFGPRGERPVPVPQHGAVR